jgi:hypothetical protein
MKDIQRAPGGTGSNDHDRCEIESKREQRQHNSRADDPQDRMKQDP